MPFQIQVGTRSVNARNSLEILMKANLKPRLESLWTVGCKTEILTYCRLMFVKIRNAPLVHNPSSFSGDGVSEGNVK